MVRHLTWCLKRMFILSNHSSLHQRFMSVRKIENSAILSKLPLLEEINVDYDEPKEYREFFEDAKCSKTLAIATITKILNTTKRNARKTVEEFPAFADLPIKSIYKNYEILREAGIYKMTIKDNIFLLGDTTESLKKKINLIKMLNIESNDAVHLFHLSIPVLSRFVNRSKLDVPDQRNSNIILYLAERLNCGVAKICQLMSYNTYMLDIQVSKILSITEFLLDSGVVPHHILTDPYVYCYHISTVKQKIKRAQKLGVRPLKPWVVRCTPHVWKKITERSNNREITLKPDQTIEEYLSELFECDITYVRFVMLKGPTFQEINFDKFVKIATLIQKEGYNLYHIQRSPRIMHRNYETLKELFDLRRKTNVKPPSLFNYLLSKEKFMKFLKIDEEKKKM